MTFMEGLQSSFLVLTEDERALLDQNDLLCRPTRSWVHWRRSDFTGCREGGFLC